MVPEGTNIAVNGKNRHGYVDACFVVLRGRLSRSEGAM